MLNMKGDYLNRPELHEKSLGVYLPSRLTLYALHVSVQPYCRVYVRDKIEKLTVLRQGNGCYLLDVQAKLMITSL